MKIEESLSLKVDSITIMVYNWQHIQQFSSEASGQSTK